MKAKRGHRRKTERRLNLTLQGKLLSIASRAENLSHKLAAMLTMLAVFCLVGCAGRPQPSRTILPDPQWTEDGWQWRDMKRAALLRGDPPVPLPLIAPAQIPAPDMAMQEDSL